MKIKMKRIERGLDEITDFLTEHGMGIYNCEKYWYKMYKRGLKLFKHLKNTKKITPKIKKRIKNMYEMLFTARCAIQELLRYDDLDGDDMMEYYDYLLKCLRKLSKK